jgi:hypothetical protein
MTTNLMTKAKARPAPATKAAVPKKTEVVTLKSVFEQIGESHGLAKKQVHGLAAGFVEALTTHLVKGDKVERPWHSRGKEPFGSQGAEPRNG